MLPGGTDSLYRAVLAAGHTHYTRIEVWSHDGVRLDTALPQMLHSTWLADDPDGGLVFIDGSMQATLGSRVARQLTLSVPSYMYPRDPLDLLAPFGNEIHAYHGVVLGDGSKQYVWQVFRGRIRDVVTSSGGACSIRCADRAADVADVNFVSPQNSVPTNTINAEWQRLIAEAVSDATFGASDLFEKTVEPLTWEFDLPSALDELCTSVGAIWYPLANGDFVLRRFPWTFISAPVLTFSDGSGGTVNSWTISRSREGMFNVVTVTGERLNGDTPVYATASDSTPGSPTNPQGNFGVKSIVVRLQTPSTLGGAQGAAEALLRTGISPIQEWNLGVVPDASLELGDHCVMSIDSYEDTQVVTGITLPLGVTGEMGVTSRSVVVGGGT